MTAERVRRGRMARLSAWNRLFHGLPVSFEELDAETLCGDPASPDERAAYVALRACAVLCDSSRQSVRTALRVAILYWFSNVGERCGEAQAPLHPRSTTFHLGEAVGTGLAWNETVALMGRKPIDFSAYLWLLEALGKEYAKQWSVTYPGTRPASIEALSGELRESAHAKHWGPGLERTPSSWRRHGATGGRAEVRSA